MSGAGDAAARLREALAALPSAEADDSTIPALLADARRLAEVVPAVARDARGANSLEGVMDGTVAVVLAAEAAVAAYKEVSAQVAHLKAECEAMAISARWALTQAFITSGNPRAETETHTATPTEGRAQFVVEDIGLVPPDLIEFEPSVKAAEAKKRLAEGPVPGLRLTEGQPGIRITVKRGRIKQ